MRMKLFDKFLLALILLLLLATSLFMGCLAAGLVSYAGVIGFLTGMGIFSKDFTPSAIGALSDVNSLIIGGAALVLFIVVIRLLVASYSGDRSQSYTRLSITENGEIAISIQTIKQIAAAFISTKPDIAASTSAILPMRDGLSVRVRICVKESTLLPDVTKALQKELKAHLETVTGLVIKEIGVLVDNNRSSYSGKGR